MQVVDEFPSLRLSTTPDLQQAAKSVLAYS